MVLLLAVVVAGAPQLWPSGDERGMANAIGPQTWGRCAEVLSQSSAKAYEVSHLRSGTMPLSPFAGPYAPKPLPTGGLKGASQIVNMDVLNEGANPAQQGNTDGRSRTLRLSRESVGRNVAASNRLRPLLRRIHPRRK